MSQQISPIVNPNQVMKAWLFSQKADGTLTPAGGSLSTPWFVQLSDGAGDALGTGAFPLRIDPTGTTIQPVSQAVAANFSDNNVGYGFVTSNAGGYPSGSIFTTMPVGIVGKDNAGNLVPQLKRVTANSGTAQATSAGNTPLIVPNVRWRLMRYQLELTGNASLAAAGILTVGLIDTSPALTITSFSISANVVTLTLSSFFNLQLGQQYVVSGLSTGTYLNGVVLTSIFGSSSTNQFQAGFVHANVGNTSDSGTLTMQPIAQHDIWLPNAAGTPSPNGGYRSGWIDLGNGHLSNATGSNLALNLSAALATGNARINFAYTSE